MVGSETLSSFFQWSQGLVDSFGYLGIFLVALVSTSTVVLPIYPLEIIIVLSGAILNPLLIGVLAGAGSALGEMVGYFIGFGGGKILKKKYKKQLKRLERYFKKYRPEIVIFGIATIPIIPFDVVGLFCGIIHFDKKKFFISLFLGKTVRFLMLALAGYYGIPWILSLFGVVI